MAESPGLMVAARTIAQFRGGVSCRRDEPPLDLTLIGRSVDRPEELLSVAFAGSTLARVPEVLEDPTVEQLDGTSFRIRDHEREWVFSAVGCHVHREVSTRFYRAIPPRAVPWSKRLFWRVVLLLAAKPLGMRLLRAIRRH